MADINKKDENLVMNQTDVANSKVLFKSGLQSAFDAIASSGNNDEYKAGTFYLTSDTNRLYIGRGGKTADLLNQAIRFIDWDDLSNITNPQENDIVYVTDQNILATYIQGSWKQINPDTVLNNSLQNTEVTGSNNQVDISNIVEDQASKAQNDSGNHFSKGRFRLKGDQDIELKANETTFEDEGQSISLGEVQFNLNLATLKSELAQYDISVVNGDSSEDPDDETASVKIKLTDNSTGSYNNANVAQADDFITISTPQYIDAKAVNKVNNPIEISHSDDTIELRVDTSSSFKDDATGFTSAGDLQLTTIVGDVVGETYTITPTIQYGKLNNLQTAKFQNATALLDVYTKDEIKQVISESLSASDAMEFQGIIASQSDLTAKQATSKKGDTYKIKINSAETDTSVVTLTLANGVTQECKTGDMLIANGTEVPQYVKATSYNQNTKYYTSAGVAIDPATVNSANYANYYVENDADNIGYITPESLVWIYIPSANDQNIQIAFDDSVGNSDNNNDKLTQTISDGNSANSQLGKFTIQVDRESHISAVYQHTDTTSDPNVSVFTIAQAEDYTPQDYSAKPNTPASLALTAADGRGDYKATAGQYATASFTAITTIKTDKYGNVVNGSIGTETIELRDSHANVKEFTSEFDCSTSNLYRGMLTQKISDTDGIEKTAQMLFTSEGSSIQITPSTENIAGVNAKLNLDIVWGSF